ncbi:hypothetical protein KXV85_005641, partial [Aspergillus fumigatus]
WAGWPPRRCCTALRNDVQFGRPSIALLRSTARERSALTAMVARRAASSRPASTTTVRLTAHCSWWTPLRMPVPTSLSSRHSRRKSSRRRVRPRLGIRSPTRGRRTRSSQCCDRWNCRRAITSV